MRMAAGALLLLLLALAAPTAAAQTLPGGMNGGAMNFAVVCPKSLVEVDYLKSAQVFCDVKDLTRDSGNVPDGPAGPGAVGHTVLLEIANMTPERPMGWQVLLSHTSLFLYGGQTERIALTITTSPGIEVADLSFVLRAVYTHSGTGEQLEQNVGFLAQVNPFDLASPPTLTEISKKAGQNEIVRYEVHVTNLGVFPDSYAFAVDAASDLKVTVPPNLYVPPGETRTTNISVLTPKGKIYELGRSEVINIKVKSNTGGTTYGTVGLMKIEGAYIPSYWAPVALLGLVSGAVVTHRAREAAELRRLEQGRPRRVQPTPRQAVMLAALKQQDPEAYKRQREKLAALYKARRDAYRDEHKKRVAADKEEARQAKVEFKEQQKRRKEQRKLAKAEAKEQRKRDKVEAKELKKKQKELGKKRKVLEKQRAKAAKKQAKLDAKQAKIDAKEAAKRAKLEAKEAKAAARAAKKQAKGGGKP